MRSGADPRIIVAAPIQQIVTRLRSRPRMIGNLVGRQPRSLAKLLGEAIQLARLLAVRDAQRAGGMPRGERRALLDGELIEREVVGGMIQRASQLRFPLDRRLSFPRIDQIERHALEMALGERKRGQRFFGRVLSSKRFEASIVERLHAERQPVDAGRPIAREILGLDAGRIGLERDLGIARQTPMSGDGIEDRRHGSGAHQGWRAAAEEDAGDVPARCQRGKIFKLAQIGGEEARLVDAAVPDMRVEVAIRAFGAAERPMHIDAKGFVHFCHRPKGSASRRRACDATVGLFRSGSISPKVSLRPSGTKIGS